MKIFQTEFWKFQRKD